MCEYNINGYRLDHPVWTDAVYGAFANEDITSCHRAFPQYASTPLRPLPGLAAQLGIGELWIKDEAGRFGLQAFKVLGASYAVYRFLKRAMEQAGEAISGPGEIMERLPAGRFTFSTATDGNHGRAVAWAARTFGQKAVIYVPRGTVENRIRNIEAEGAEVIVVDGNYDETVNRVDADAARLGRQIIADTAYPGYMTIPADIMAGYLTLFREMETELHRAGEAGVDLVVVQAGVGSLAAAAVWYYVSRYGASRPRLAAVEPLAADCLLESIRYGGGGIKSSRGNQDSMMAGLNCGTPSLLAWPIIRDGMDLFLAVADRYSKEAMRLLYHPRGGDPQIVSGESGAGGLAALLALLGGRNTAPAAAHLGLGKTSRVLLINTEGATDPDNFVRIVSGG